VLRGLITLGLAVASLGLAAPALAGSWLPHAKGADWVYQWQDSVYNPTPTKEKVTVKTTKGGAFTLAWTTDGQGNPTAAPTSNGTVSFAETPNGLVNTNWTSNPPPAGYPILCASTSQCGNSLASTYYNVIWGSRAPVLEEPLLRGTSWATTGGTQNDVGSSNRYVGTELVSVPAFSRPVEAAKVQSTITQAGALGDPYGSGVRTVWWVYGVGPVKVSFAHTGGSKAPVTTAVLLETNQEPQAPPPDANYFPLAKGQTFSYRWTNTRHLKSPVVEKFVVDAASNGTARFTVASVSGPIKVAGAYGYTSTTAGLANIWGTVKAASIAKLPKLGPASLPAKKRRHFFTPFDLMNFGFEPILPAYPTAGTSWTGHASGIAYSIFGVTGATRVLGLQTVTVPAGTFRALAVRSTLVQKGFPFGSGTRIAWFAPGRGLVKLVFQHGDGSVSDVELLR
jgi:hypothetical protein